MRTIILSVFVLALMVAVLTFLPCLMVIVWPTLRKRQAKVSDCFFSSSIVDKLVNLIVGQRRNIFLLLIIVSLFLLVGIFRIRVETNPLSYFKTSTPLHQQFHDIYDHLSGSFPLHLKLKSDEDDFFLSKSAIDILSDHQRFLETLPGIDKTLSFADYLKLVNYVTNRFDPLFYKLPEADYEIRMLTNQFKTILGRDILKRYIADDFATANITMLTRLHSANGFLDAEKMIQKFCKRHEDKKVTCHTTGFGMVMSLGSQHLVNGQAWSLLITLFIIFTPLFRASLVKISFMFSPWNFKPRWGTVRPGYVCPANSYLPLYFMGIPQLSHNFTILNELSSRLRTRVACLPRPPRIAALIYDSISPWISGM